MRIRVMPDEPKIPSPEMPESEDEPRPVPSDSSDPTSDRVPGAVFNSTLIHVDAARRGSQDAWWRLDEKVRPMLMSRFAGHKLPKGVSLDDVVQDVLLTVLRRFARFEVRAGSDFRGFVIKRMQDRITDLWRRDQAKKRGGGWNQVADGSMAMEMLQDIQDDRVTSQSVALQRQELSDRIDRAYESLTDKQRMVLEMRMRRGMSSAEIAKELGFNKESTVRALTFRAKERIKELLRDMGDEVSGD